jgi:hypothetical protein
MRWDRLALTVWVVVMGVICVRAFGWPYVHSLYPIYSTAARNWQAGEDVYAKQKDLADLYRYSPTAAVLFNPLSQLPDNLGGLLWRLLNVGVYFWGVAWWCKAVVPGGSSFSRQQWALLWLLMLPLSLESLNNGQINPLIVGLTLGAVAAVAEGRWNLAAVCAALTGLLKIYPLAVGLLLVLVYPRKFGPRFAAALTVGLALPFLFQSFDYVVQEYATWFQLLGGDDRSKWPLRIAPQDLWLLLRVTHLPVSKEAYLVVRVALAAGLAALCFAWRWRGSDDRQLLTILSTQACCWMILCGPNSEPCTYILLAPVLAWAVVDAWRPGRTLWVRVGMVVVIGVFLMPFAIRALSGGEDNAAGFMPLGTCLMSLYLLATTRLADDLLHPPGKLAGVEKYLLPRPLAHDLLHPPGKLAGVESKRF